MIGVAFHAHAWQFKVFAFSTEFGVHFLQYVRVTTFFEIVNVQTARMFVKNSLFKPREFPLTFPENQWSHNLELFNSRRNEKFNVDRRKLCAEGVKKN